MRHCASNPWLRVIISADFETPSMICHDVTQAFAIYRNLIADWKYPVWQKLEFFKLLNLGEIQHYLQQYR